MFFLVDAFTDQKFKGNPAGVFIVEDFPPKQNMQQMASFFKFPDLAFVKYVNNQTFQIRWFSPMDESPICGHASIAAAHVIFTKINPQLTNINFLYNGGQLRAVKTEEGIVIIFKTIYSKKCTKTPFNIKQTIGLKYCEDIYEDKHSYMVFLKKREDIFTITPNFTSIRNLPKRSLIVTSPGFGHYDFCLRYFVPKIGINEDPVCGSANCKASIIWSRKLNKKHLLSYQASEREGIVKISVNDAEEKVSILGMATIICEFQTL